MKYLYSNKGIPIKVSNDDYKAFKDIKFNISGFGYAHYSGKYLHKMIKPSSEVVDHINGDKLDNRRSNLRVVTRSLNRVNSKMQRNKSGFRGVYWRPDRNHWIARMNAGGKYHYIGSFKTKLEAAMAWDKFATEYCGTKININERSLL